MTKPTELFGIHLFNDDAMRRTLPESVYQKLQHTIRDGKTLDSAIADTVAQAMKTWAQSLGATHYTHWFQPMTGRTGEKHEAFLTLDNEGRPIELFSGKNLTIGEPDASSFPTGGLRATFEARGYTAWDCTSPAFIKETNGGKTLCIPTAFCSYNGEALDMKTPLLRSMQALEEAAKRILALFGDPPKRVLPTVGAEQEYFLIDKRLYQQRKDLIYTGRTLFGAKPPKGQELSDHYFGSIRRQIANFMRDIDIELWKLGIVAKTRHYEVAPGQYELAPLFATVNIATDQNQLIMEVLEEVANRYDLVCLLHEKPFSYFNGSGKHNNWSLMTSDGVNLFEPGDTPHANLQFLLFFVAVVSAVDRYADLLRLSAATYSNDLRLGMQEAPPAIISLFVGEQMRDILNQIEAGALLSSKQADHLDTGVVTLPKMLKDVTDRNRTSPFAFTGNKFEFRMVGSSESIAEPNIVLNTIVADRLNAYADELTHSLHLIYDIKRLLQREVQQHKRILFDGNGYSEEWVQEAKKRELGIYPTTIDVLPCLLAEKNMEVFMKHRVFTRSEILSRYEVRVNHYITYAQIEANTMVNMMEKDILPAVLRYIREVASAYNQVCQAGFERKALRLSQRLGHLLHLYDEGSRLTQQLQGLLSQRQRDPITFELAKNYQDQVLPLMKALREIADAMECLVPRDSWPFPTYGDLVFRS